MDSKDVIIADTAEIACDGGGGPLGHPQVYLSFGDQAEITCPYCSRRFRLAADAKIGHGH